VHIAGPQITEERLKSYWTSMGVTSALVGSMAFSGIYTGPVEHFGADQTPRVVVELYAMSMGFSLLTSLTAVIISTLLHSQMNNLPRLEDTKWFILKYEKYHMAPTILFKAAIGSLGFALVMGCWPLYGLRVTAFVVTVAILLTGAVMSVYVRMIRATKKRLSKAISNARELRHVFKMIDADGSGTIDLDELKEAMAGPNSLQIQNLLGVSPAHVTKVFERMDSDGTNEIDWEEFRVHFAMSSKVNSLNSLDDGHLSSDNLNLY